MLFTTGNYYSQHKTTKKIDKKALVVGNSFSALETAYFCLRDAKLDSKNITLLISKEYNAEKLNFPFEYDLHSECSWDFFKDLSLKDENLFEKIYLYNEEEKNNRILIRDGDNSFKRQNFFDLNEQDFTEIGNLFVVEDEILKKITVKEHFSDHFFKTGFWYLMKNLFNYRQYYNCLKFRYIIERFLAIIGNENIFSNFKFHPETFHALKSDLLIYLKEKGVNVIYIEKIEDFIIQKINDKYSLKEILVITDKGEFKKTVDENTFVYLEPFDCNLSSRKLDLKKQLVISKDYYDKFIILDKLNVDGRFNNVKEFYEDEFKSIHGYSAEIHIDEKTIVTKFKNITDYKDGLYLFKDSNWQFNLKIKELSDNLYLNIHIGAFNVSGNFVKKTFKECSDEEFLFEIFSHIEPKLNEFLTKESLKDLSFFAISTPGFLPSEEKTSLPKIFQEDFLNIYFIGPFIDFEDEIYCSFEYLSKIAMKAVYESLKIDRKIPDNKSYLSVDILLNSTKMLLEGRKITNLNYPLTYKIAINTMIKQLNGNIIDKKLRQYDII